MIPAESIANHRAAEAARMVAARARDNRNACFITDQGSMWVR
jgi:hypothetical protein